MKSDLAIKICSKNGTTEPRGAASSHTKSSHIYRVTEHRVTHINRGILIGIMKLYGGLGDLA